MNYPMSTEMFFSWFKKINKNITNVTFYKLRWPYFLHFMLPKFDIICTKMPQITGNTSAHNEIVLMKGAFEAC